MDFYFTKKDLIFLLNSICITKYFLKYHTSEEKKIVSYYFDFEYYYETYHFLDLIYKRLSLEGNRVFYNLQDEIYYLGQQNFISDLKNQNKKIFRKNKKLLKVLLNKIKNIKFML